MRLLAIGIGIAVLVFIVTAGHVIFLPLLFLPLGLFSLGHRRRQQPSLPPGRRQGWFRSHQ
jgi:hypothetical protein